MQGYLLDTNHVFALYHKNQGVIQKIASLPVNTQIRACTITLGEIEAGHSMNKTTNQGKRDTFTAFVNKEFLPNALPVSHSTRIYYAQILGRIWQQKPPAKSSVGTDAHLVQLGVNINDVWIVSVAWEHGLILVTEDKMSCIRQAISSEVQIENWKVL